MKLRLALILPLAASLFAAVPAVAQSKAIGRFNDWRVYTQGEGRQMICFATVEASDKAPKSTEHGEVVFYVTAWKSGAASNQMSLEFRRLRIRLRVSSSEAEKKSKFGLSCLTSGLFSPSE